MTITFQCCGGSDIELAKSLDDFILGYLGEYQRFADSPSRHE